MTAFKIAIIFFVLGVVIYIFPKDAKNFAPASYPKSLLDGDVFFSESAAMEARYNIKNYDRVRANWDEIVNEKSDRKIYILTEEKIRVYRFAGGYQAIYADKPHWHDWKSKYMSVDISIDKGCYVFTAYEGFVGIFMSLFLIFMGAFIATAGLGCFFEFVD